MSTPALCPNCDAPMVCTSLHTLRQTEFTCPKCRHVVDLNWKEYKECPFCGEKDFDAIGLKAHLGWCEAMANVMTLEQEFEARERAAGDKRKEPKL